MCAHTHGGTSAAVPNAVGVFALALGSTVSHIVQYVLWAFSESIFRALEQI